MTDDSDYVRQLEDALYALERKDAQIQCLECDLAEAREEIADLRERAEFKEQERDEARRELSALQGHSAGTSQPKASFDAFRWTGDLDAFEKWFGSRWPVDAGEQISVPVGPGDKGPFLRVWCGSWIIRRGERCDVLSDWAMRYMCDEFHMDLPKQHSTEGGNG